jgi:hypothetical protein
MEGVQRGVFVLRTRTAVASRSSPHRASQHSNTIRTAPAGKTACDEGEERAIGRPPT